MVDAVGSSSPKDNLYIKKIQLLVLARVQNDPIASDLATMIDINSWYSIPYTPILAMGGTLGAFTRTGARHDMEPEATATTPPVSARRSR